MSATTASLFVFSCTFGGALLGMFIHRLLPAPHASSESKDIVRISMGLVATIVALVLGLLIYSAKSFYDTQNSEVTQLAANVVLLDRLLAHYGPETAEVRAELRRSIQVHLKMMWPENGSERASPQSFGPTSEAILDRIQELSPKDDRQRTLQGQAVNLAVHMGQTRLLMFTQRSVAVPKLLLMILIFWLNTLFVSFGLFAPTNYTVVLSLFIAAAAVCGAVFLMVEMYYPYGGVIEVSRAPLISALAQLGR